MTQDVLQIHQTWLKYPSSMILTKWKPPNFQPMCSSPKSYHKMQIRWCVACYHRRRPLEYSR
ncbi:hypothetical protein HKD37_02G005120 [Glycine soja]